MLNTRRFVPDDRTQKTNYILNTDKSFDTLLVGSSRVWFIDQRLFENSSTFNYALGAMYPDEYDGFISAAAERHPLRKVYIGLDFFGTSKNKMFLPLKKQSDYMADATKRMRMLGMLLSRDGAFQAVQTIRFSLFDAAVSGEYADHDFIGHRREIIQKNRYQTVLNQLLLFGEKGYGAGYEWNEGLDALFRNLRERHPELVFVVFTTPISAPMFSLLVRDGRLPEYERWLGLLVQNFDTVYDFMGLNSITTDLGNYVDAHHLKDARGRIIVDRLEGRDALVPSDFGVRVTRENLEGHLADIRSQVGKLDPDPVETFRAKANGQASN